MTDRPDALQRSADGSADLDELMRRIRIELSERRAGEDAALPEMPPSTPPATPPEVMPVALPPGPSIDPARRRYAVQEFMALHDAAFLRVAYLGVLGREPDAPGWARHLADLRQSRLSRVDILDALASSPEGRARGVVIDGLRALQRRERIVRTRGIRSIAAGMKGLLRLRRLPAVQGQLLELSDRAALAGARADAAESAAHQAARDAAELAKQVRALQGSLAAERSEARAASARTSRLEHGIAVLEQRLGELSVQCRQVGDTAENVAQVATEVHALRTQASEHWRAVVDQKLRLDMLLTEARRRLPEPFDATQLAHIAGEQDHLLDAFYVAFEDRYRGTRADIKQRQSVYLPRIRAAVDAAGSAPVLDIGCGRGEWLELLRENGIAARGYDLNRIMVAECCERGLDATLGDALEAIRAMPADSLAAVTGFHIIEHIPFTMLVGLFDQCLRVLRPGGVVVFETPNPANLQVAAERFYLDPTHRNPLPSELVAFVAEARGLSRVEVLALHPMEPPVAIYDDRMLELLRQKLFGPQDYGVIAWKAA